MTMRKFLSHKAILALIGSAFVVAVLKAQNFRGFKVNPTAAESVNGVFNGSSNIVKDLVPSPTGGDEQSPHDVYQMSGPETVIEVSTSVSEASSNALSETTKAVSNGRTALSRTAQNLSGTLEKVGKPVGIFAGTVGSYFAFQDAKSQWVEYYQNPTIDMGTVAAANTLAASFGGASVYTMIATGVMTSPAAAVAASAGTLVLLHRATHAGIDAYFAHLEAQARRMEADLAEGRLRRRQQRLSDRDYNRRQLNEHKENMHRLYGDSPMLTCGTYNTIIENLNRWKDHIQEQNSNGNGPNRFSRQCFEVANEAIQKIDLVVNGNGEAPGLARLCEETETAQSELLRERTRFQQSLTSELNSTDAINTNIHHVNSARALSGSYSEQMAGLHGIDAILETTAFGTGTQANQPVENGGMSLSGYQIQLLDFADETEAIGNPSRASSIRFAASERGTCGQLKEAFLRQRRHLVENTYALFMKAHEMEVLAQEFDGAEQTFRSLANTEE